MSRTLLSGGGPEPGHQLGGHPPPVLHLDALRLGPHADLGAIHPARRPAPASGRPPRTAPGPPRGLYIARQRIPQRLGMLGGQVDLILGAVQPEADRAVSRAAIQVIDQQNLYLLGHRCFLSSLTSQPGQPTLPSASAPQCCERSQHCPEAIMPDRWSCPNYITAI